MKSFKEIIAEAIDSIPYHSEMNPKLWDNEHLIPEIREALLKIALHFGSYINDPWMRLHDVTISGSNAAYNYAPNSDLDLHLVVDMREEDLEEAELYDAKKNQYNSMYNIKVRGIDVELYVQNSKQAHYSSGIYSILHDKWLVKPHQEHITVSYQEVENKANNYDGKIQVALQSDDLAVAKGVMDDIRKLRTAGLATGGEFSVENLAFKLLRTQGEIDALRTHILRLQSTELSFEETQVSETVGIKGWKNAHSDIMKHRAAAKEAGKSVQTVRLKKDGGESGMHDAKKGHSSVEDAEKHHENLKSLNPGRNVAHNLYVDGKLVKKLS